MLTAGTPEHALSIERLATDGPAAACVPDPLVGTVVGHWRVLRLLGRGGMGSVYLAERADGQYRMHVALKLISPDSVTGQGVERFRTERQVLANLQHPNIARLLDGGRAPDGRPYLVMDLVEGVPITEWIRTRSPSLEAKLRLFCTVCEAVQHAHAARVVHRDLKPANILVSSAGQVKLIDFGIAKLLEHDPAGPITTPTREGGRVLTPEYAAPEQLDGEPISPATDVYALGVVLHELLTGRHPAEASGRRVLGWMKAADDTEPPLMSRAVPHGRLRSLLRGDLDTVVARALKKGPTERYPSAGDLGEDLGRILAHRPIQARPPRLAYRAGRFLRRHRWAVAAAFLTVGSLSIVAHEVYQKQAASERQRREKSEGTVKLARAADPTGAPMRGEPNAPVTIVEFCAFGFPFRSCALVQNSLKELMSAYPKEVRLVFKVVAPSPHSRELAAEAAMAAHEQGKFWPMHDCLFADQGELDRAALERHADAIGLDLGKFRAALDSRKFRATVDANRQLFKDVQGGRTPVFPTSLINGEPVYGAWPPAMFARKIEQSLGRDGSRVDNLFPRVDGRRWPPPPMVPRDFGSWGPPGREFRPIRSTGKLPSTRPDRAEAPRP